MKILYINHYAGGPKYGMEFRPHYLAREWVKSGHSVTVAAASYAHVRTRQPEAPHRFTTELIDGVHYVWCRTPRYDGNGVSRVLNILAFLNRLNQWKSWLPESPDAVIASSTYPLDIYPARSIARHFDARLVWEVHDLWPLSPMELGGMSRRHPFIMLLQRAEDTACREANAVVSILPMTSRHLQDHGMAAGKFIHIPNGIDPSEWNTPNPGLPPAQLALILDQARRDGHLTVGYAGSHGIANALDTMLDAAELMRGEKVTWILIGSGPEKARLVARTRNWNPRNLHFLDAIPKSSIPAALRPMDVLYIGFQRQPLYRFGIGPNKLMDYMMAARPVILACEAGNDPVAEAQCGFTIPPDSASQLADCVRRLASMSHDERNALGAMGRHHVESHLVYPVLARRFIEAMRPGRS